MIAQATGMDIGGFEVVAQSVHRQQRGVACLITEVVAELTACQFGATVWLGCNKFRRLAVLQVMAHEWEGNATEIRAAAETTDHDIGIFACHLHLFLSLKADDGLMESHVIEHRAQYILTVRCGGG